MHSNSLNISTNYYPFGMIMPREDDPINGKFGNKNTGDYRFGFNGKESDDEIKGTKNSYDYGARMYDPRLGRWLSTDPLLKKYPGNSPYSYVLNNPLYWIDFDGKDLWIGGNREQAQRDIQSLIPEGYKDRISLTIKDDGQVLFEVSMVSLEEIKSEPGIDLLNNLINISSNKYLYEVNDEIADKAFKEQQPDENGIVTTVGSTHGSKNAPQSITPYRTKIKQPVITKKGKVKMRKIVVVKYYQHYRDPAEGFDGSVTIFSDKYEFVDVDDEGNVFPETRVSTIFHEFFEIFEMTDNYKEYMKAHQAAKDAQEAQEEGSPLRGRSPGISTGLRKKQVAKNGDAGSKGSSFDKPTEKGTKGVEKSTPHD